MLASPKPTKTSANRRALSAMPRLFVTAKSRRRDRVGKGTLRTLIVTWLGTEYIRHVCLTAIIGAQRQPSGGHFLADRYTPSLGSAIGYCCKRCSVGGSSTPC
jgi:hypothetical protein